MQTNVEFILFIISIEIQKNTEQNNLIEYTMSNSKFVQYDLREQENTVICGFCPYQLMDLGQLIQFKAEDKVRNRLSPSPKSFRYSNKAIFSNVTSPKKQSITNKLK